MAYLPSQRDVPGTQREYETIYILRPDAATEQIHDVNTRVRKVIEDSGGSLIRVDNWGKRKLAYEIKKELKGIYLYWLYLGGAELVAEIERNLRMLDLVIRYYTVKIDETVDPEARPSQMDDESFAATATTVPDEEDAYLGRVQEEAPTSDTPAATTGETPAATTEEAKAPAPDTATKDQPAQTADAAAQPKPADPEATAQTDAEPAAPAPQAAASETPAETPTEAPTPETPPETTQEKKED